MTAQNQQTALLGKIAAYTEILAKDPRSTIFVSLGEAYRKIGMLDDARRVIENGLVNHPDFSPAHIVLARILCQQGEYDNSAAAFQQALALDTESLAAFVGFARLHILLGDEQKARELLLQARQLSPADPVINKLLLSLPEPATPVQEDLSPVEESEEEGVEEESSKPPLVSSTVADLYLKQGLKEDALEVYRQLSEEEPDNLLYRRKIRSLEEELTAPSAAEEEQEEVPEPMAETTAVAPEVAAEPMAEEDLSAGKVESGDVENSEDRVLATLNNWLDSIQRRREDV